MNALTLTQANVSITSREIADLVEKRHDNVKRTIETLVNQRVIESPQIEEIPTATRPVTIYRFTGEQGKRDSIVVVAQLSPEFTARLVDRWQELEAQIQQPALNPANMSRLQLLEMAMAAEQERLTLEHKIEEQAPKVQGFDRIANAEGLLSLRETATTLKIPERQFIQWMQRHDWLYRRPGKGTLLAYSQRIKEGYLEHKAVTIHNDRTGSDEVRESVKVTPLGLTALAKRVHDMQEVA